jgi:hypothetical protein
LKTQTTQRLLQRNAAPAVSIQRRTYLQVPVCSDSYPRACMCNRHNDVDCN